MPLEEGDTVRHQAFVDRKAPWAKGQVIRRLDDRSYEVRSGDHTHRRYRTHMKPTNAPPDKPTSPHAPSSSKTALPTSPGIPTKAASPEKMKQPTLP